MTTLCCFLFLFPIHRWLDLGQDNPLSPANLLQLNHFLSTFAVTLHTSFNIQTYKNAAAWTCIIQKCVKSLSKVIYWTTNSCKSQITIKKQKIFAPYFQKSEPSIKTLYKYIFVKCRKYVVFNNKHFTFDRVLQSRRVSSAIVESPVSALTARKGAALRWRVAPAENCGIMLRVNVLVIISGCWILNGICPSSPPGWRWARARQDLHPIL